MAKDPQPPQDGDGEGQQDSALTDRVHALETGQESLSSRVDKILGILDGGGHAGEPTEPEPRGGTPAGIAHEIRTQIDKAAADKAARDKEDGRDTTIAELKEQVRALTEQEPAPPPRRSERIMGWH